MGGVCRGICIFYMEKSYVWTGVETYGAGVRAPVKYYINLSIRIYKAQCHFGIEAAYRRHDMLEGEET